MIRFEIEELDSIPEWRSLLAAYRDWSATARAQSTEFDGWLPRVAAIDGINSERLPAVHGRLIALGFLKFQVGGRAVGLQYQLAPEGRRALETDVMSDDPADDFVEAETAGMES